MAGEICKVVKNKSGNSSNTVFVLCIQRRNIMSLNRVMNLNTLLASDICHCVTVLPSGSGL